MKSKKDVLRQTEKAGFHFLVTDLDLALTLMHIASDAAEGSEKRARNRANARQAYDTISRISSHALLTDEERQVVKDKVAQLRSALERLGEVFN